MSSLPATTACRPRRKHLNCRGGGVPLHLKIDLTRKSREQETIGRGRKFQTSVRLSCKLDERTFEHEIVVGGRVRDVLSINPIETYLGEHSVLSQPLPPFRLPLRPLGAVITSVQADAGAESGWVIQSAFDSKGKWKLELTAPKSLPVGSFQVPVVLKMVTPDGITRRRLVYSGRIADDIELTPSSVAFTPSTVSSTVTETLSLRSRSGQYIQIERVEFNGVGGKCEVTRTSMDRCSVALHQKVLLPGKQERLLTLTIADSEGRKSVMQCTYWYYGRVAENDPLDLQPVALR